MEYKYIVLFPVPEPEKSLIIEKMDRIERLTGIPAPHKKLPPHMTFHRPIERIDEKTILNFTESMVRQIRQTRITVSNLFAFGQKYIVLPVHATRSLASLWVGLNDLLAKLPKYQHGKYDYENTLHITLAEIIQANFDLVWSTLSRETFEPMEIPVQTVEVWRKGLAEGQQWEKVITYELDLLAFGP